MLGSLAEADDAVQEAWLRLDRAEPADVANPRGWLTTVVSRICLDMLRTRTSRREEPLDQRAEGPAPTSAEQELMLADSVGLALLVVLDKLEPAERIAFVLHDLFGVPFDDVATILTRSPDAARQLASRARRRVQGSPPPDTDLASQRHVVDSFIVALKSGDLQGLIAILDPEIVMSADVAGTITELRGRDLVARNWTEGAAAFARFADLFTVALLDGSLGLVMAPKGRLVRALRFTFENGLIARAEIIGDRARLDALDVAPID
ncbi:MAG: sigma-70 family RNA polymerase sigma factor [Deltaproteobacteria bacterium]|nr:sigma-70 family RNA polymerase sigma factor [Deltaproteobacteria bacterium]